MNPRREQPDAERPVFEGGDPPCWAHLFEDFEEVPSEAPVETLPPDAAHPDQAAPPSDATRLAERSPGNLPPAPAADRAAP